MNALTNTSPEYRHTRTKDRSTPRLDLFTAKVTAAPVTTGNVKRSRALDCRLCSLKVLAVTLLNEIEALENSTTDEVSELNLQTEVRRFEAELIRNALVRTGGKQRRAARLLGMKVTTLNTKIRRYKIESHAASEVEIAS
jgi:transcriptional regulator with GAF, ATPase, and Fis domain